MLKPPSRLGKPHSRRKKAAAESVGRPSDACICGRPAHSCPGHSLRDAIEPITGARGVVRGPQHRLVDSLSNQGHPFDALRPMTGPSHCTFGRELRPCTLYTPSIPASLTGSFLKDPALKEFTGKVRASDGFAYGYKGTLESLVDTREWANYGGHHGQQRARINVNDFSTLGRTTNFAGRTHPSIKPHASARTCGFGGYSDRSQTSMTRIYHNTASRWRNEG